MKTRTHWIAEIERAWTQKSVIWLPGVRRVGKTTLCKSLSDVEYLDCELPRQRRRLEDPESFLESVSGKRVALDEIHRLRNPSEFLKIAADHYPNVRIVATGSSTLAAKRKFRDTLTGRKAELWLTPAMSLDLDALKVPDLETRLLRGGLPPFLLAKHVDEPAFQEWMDAYWGKDIQELFRVERRDSFLRFVELLLAASGGIFEATRYARPCEVSRPTIANYLAVLEITLIAHIIRPYSTGKTTEIVAAPKVYGFDTGFVCYFRGWNPLRRDDLGLLWEHYVLNEMHARLQTRQIQYWRDKQGHEVDFVIARRGAPPIAIECKWSADNFDPASLRAFANRYPRAELFVVSQDIQARFTKSFGSLRVQFLSLEVLIQVLASASRRLG